VVGLDPRVEQLPAALRPNNPGSAHDVASSYRQFCRRIIDVVASRVAVVKPQLAFFEELGPAGMTALADVIRYAREQGLLVIADGKRNDIGSTASAYAAAYLANSVDSFSSDALTVSPYLGDDSLQPFVDATSRHSTGAFVLVKTSNPGGRMLQDLVADGRPVYVHVAEHVQRLAEKSRGECGYGAIGAVVGATYPRQLMELRQAMPNAWILVPGYGAQGGSADDVQHAFDERGLGGIINSSRGIIFAYHRPELRSGTDVDWVEAVAAATEEMIRELRENTPAGNL
jgi:orotidine-5'-phosphate decarboxylase